MRKHRRELIRQTIEDHYETLKRMEDGNMSEKLNEPKEHVIDGVKYREVERKAEVGEKVIIVNAEDHNSDGYSNGAIFIADRNEKRFDGLTFMEGGVTLYNREYRVLEAVEEAPISPSSPDLIELVSRLIAKVSHLESELDTVRKNVQTFAEQTESNTKDIAAIDERAQVLNAIQSFYKTGGERQ